MLLKEDFPDDPEVFKKGQSQAFVEDRIIAFVTIRSVLVVVASILLLFLCTPKTY